MPVKVVLPNAFQKHTNNVREITSSAANLRELVTDIESRFPDLSKHLRGEDGQIRRFINFYVSMPLRRGMKSWLFHRLPVVRANLSLNRSYQRPSFMRAFLLRASYRGNKVFAAYLLLVHFPLTMSGGYYSRDSARWAEVSVRSITRFHANGGNSGVNLTLLPASGFRKTSSSRRSRHIPAATR